MSLSKDSRDRIKKKGKKLSNYEIEEAYDEARVASEFSDFKKIRLSEKQVILYEGIKNHVITTIRGAAGTAKTFTCCYAAMEALRNREVKKIYLVKPLETSGEDVGFLPGDIDQKMSPYMASFMDNLKDLVAESDLKAMMYNKVIEFVPMAFMRGRTLKDCYIVADELQNFDYKQLMTLITRMGKNCKVMLIGDQAQNDINKRMLAFDFFIDSILNEPEVFNFKFERTDIVRHPLLIKIVDNYEKALHDNKLPETKNKN